MTPLRGNLPLELSNRDDLMRCLSIDFYGLTREELLRFFPLSLSLACSVYFFVWNSWDTRLIALDSVYTPRLACLCEYDLSRCEMITVIITLQSVGCPDDGIHRLGCNCSWDSSPQEWHTSVFTGKNSWRIELNGKFEWTMILQSVDENELVAPGEGRMWQQGKLQLARSNRHWWLPKDIYYLPLHRFAVAR